MSAPLTTSRATFYTKTPAQLRSFRLLTLAQMVHLESLGIGMTGRSAKRQAMESLDLTGTTEGAGMVETGELIEGLRDLAIMARGLAADTEAPTRPLPPQGGQQ